MYTIGECQIIEPSFHFLEFGHKRTLWAYDFLGFGLVFVTEALLPQLLEMAIYGSRATLRT